MDKEVAIFKGVFMQNGGIYLQFGGIGGFNQAFWYYLFFDKRNEILQYLNFNRLFNLFHYYFFNALKN